MRGIVVSILIVAVAGAWSCSGPEKEGSVMLLAVPDDPTVSVTIWFKTGSRNDPPGREGLAYLTGRMIAEGSTSENSFEEILQKLYPLASEYSVRVDKEMTTVTGRTHRDNVDVYFDLLTEALLDLLLDVTRQRRALVVQGDHDPNHLELGVGARLHLVQRLQKIVRTFESVIRRLDRDE